MSLTQTQSQLLASVRQYSDTGGTNSTQRHPDANVKDYINRALGSLHRKLTEALPDQRFLSSTTVTTSAGTATYSLPADFDFLISVDLTANGVKAWLLGFEMPERPALTDPSASYTGIPFTYRIRGANIEYLPTPSAAYTSTLWYVPAASQLASTSDTYDTISRLDDYIVAYATKFIATKDKNWDLVGECRATCTELEGDIRSLARSRDRNSPPRIVDERVVNRWGRSVIYPRRWR